MKRAKRHVKKQPAFLQISSCSNVIFEASLDIIWLCMYIYIYTQTVYWINICIIMYIYIYIYIHNLWDIDMSYRYISYTWSNLSSPGSGATHPKVSMRCGRWQDVEKRWVKFRDLWWNGCTNSLLGFKHVLTGHTFYLRSVQKYVVSKRDVNRRERHYHGITELNSDLQPWRHQRCPTFIVILLPYVELF